MNKKGIMTTEDAILTMAIELGNEYGFAATAAITEFKDFKINWWRTANWFNLRLPDYLLYLPKDTVRDILERAFCAAVGGEHTCDPSTAEALLSEEFRALAQPIYLKRYRGLSKSGLNPLNSHDTEYGTWDWLGMKGLVDGPRPAIRWKKGIKSPRCSAIFNTIILPLRDYHTIFDMEEVWATERMVYEMYCEICYGRAKIRGEDFNLEAALAKYEHCQPAHEVN